ncbi:outer membrane protein assembly factor BamB family protein [Pleomorphovibrio marinus]|uniref:outer membrane protein assembly factor BamB family protein n=1 Tax=Pleomorphovibrio marinus TaxID=2164132 RepID=UPI000E0AAE3D|nr:PQQ-binding-like beta-propeller repeat protein [Pleomorphovibrio marinus]
MKNPKFYQRARVISGIVLLALLSIGASKMGWFGLVSRSKASVAATVLHKMDRVPDWVAEMEGIGTFSSPRVADLNGDGIGDIILGAGRQEFQSSDTAVMALDGRDGNLLWHHSSTDQVFGSALLHDINQDGIQDIVIGGRNGILKAINGKTGTLFWDFDKMEAHIPLIRERYFNFYNPQLIPDLDGDGVEDIIVSNGGDVLKQPFDPHRPEGYLMVLSAATGEVLYEARMPDGKETYFSLAVKPSDKQSDTEILFGTGGETLGGGLYVTNLDAVIQGDLSGAKQLAYSEEKGFIAPPIWVDLTGNNELDVVAAGVDGTCYAFEGGTKRKLWELAIPGTEIYASPGIGFFTGSDTPDVFISAAIGTWPNFTFTKHVMIEGGSGKLSFQDTLGYFQSSSPLAIDLNRDGRDEVIISVNYENFGKEGRKLYTNTLFVIDFLTASRYELLEPQEGHNIASTPWMGDLDKDGYLDLVYCHSSNPYHGFAFDRMRVNRIKTEVLIPKRTFWGAYMGNGYDGVFLKK